MYYINCLKTTTPIHHILTNSYNETIFKTAILKGIVMQIEKELINHRFRASKLS